MRTGAQGRVDAKRHAARRGDFVDHTADRASSIDPRRRGLGDLCPSPAPPVPPACGDELPIVTVEMISRLAQRYWELHGGNAVLNWLEAERALQDLLRHEPAGEPSAAERQPSAA